MTKEEIEKKLRDIDKAEHERERRLFGGPIHHDVALPDLGERILRENLKLCLALVSQAYEEAAQAVEQNGAADDNCECDENSAHLALHRQRHAEAIRALKDSPAPSLSTVS